MNECSYFEYLGLQLVPYDQLPKGLYTVSPEGERLRIGNTVYRHPADPCYTIPNLTTSIADWPRERCGSLNQSFFEAGPGEYLSWDCLQPLFTLKIAWDDGYKNYGSTVKLPRYQMLGKPITPDQAFDIIRRTDLFFNLTADRQFAPDNFICCVHFCNNWFDASYGWCHPDGRIGSVDMTATTAKWPDAQEFADEWCRQLYAFPFLDLIIIVWNIDGTIWGSEEKEVTMKDIDCGIYVHDNRIEFLNPKHTMEIFQRYNAQYGNALEAYDGWCTEEHQLYCDDKVYLKRCIAANQQITRKIFRWPSASSPCLDNPKEEKLIETQVKPHE